jgi:hypothetical protein
MLDINSFKVGYQARDNPRLGCKNKGRDMAFES